MLLSLHFLREYTLEEVANKLKITKQSVQDHKERIVCKVYKASDQDSVAYVESFLAWYYNEFESVPASPLLEKLANFVLRPYIGDKTIEHKILSGYSLERRDQKQTNYIEWVGC